MYSNIKMDKLEIILEWAEERNKFVERKKRGNKFDTTFLESVKDFYQETGDITTAQENAIDNIYDKFNIQSWDDRRNSDRRP